MADYTITFASSARRELEKMERATAHRILNKIAELSNEPRPAGCRKLQGGGGLWRLRVGDYRVIYSVNDDQRVVDVAAVRHRREVYR